MLTDEEIRFIRRNPYNFSYSQLGKQFGISAWSIRQITDKKRYTDVQPLGRDSSGKNLAGKDISDGR